MACWCMKIGWESGLQYIFFILSLFFMDWFIGMKSWRIDLASFVLKILLTRSREYYFLTGPFMIVFIITFHKLINKMKKKNCWTKSLYFFFSMTVVPTWHAYSPIALLIAKNGYIIF